MELQSKVTANNSLREIANARQNRLQHTIRKGLNQPGNGGENAGWMYRSGGSGLFNAIKKAASPGGEFDKEQFRLLKDQVSAVIAQHVTENGKYRGDQLKRTLDSMGINAELRDIVTVIDALMARDSDAKAAHDAVLAINKNTKAVDDAKAAINSKLDDGKDPKKDPKKDPNKDPNTTPKDTPEKIKERLTGKIAAANDDLAQGFITNEECVRKLSQAYMDAYQELRSLTGATGADNEYTGKAKLYNDRVKAAPIKKVKGGDLLTGKAEPSVKAEPVKPPVTETGLYQPKAGSIKVPRTFEEGFDNVTAWASDSTGALTSLWNVTESTRDALKTFGDDAADT